MHRGDIELNARFLPFDILIMQSLLGSIDMSARMIFKAYIGARHRIIRIIHLIYDSR